MKLKLIQYILILLATAATLGACNKEIEDYVPREFMKGEDSFLRVVNTASFPRRIDFYVNNQKMSGDSLSYNSSFPALEFLRAPSGNVTFKATAPALGNDVFTANYTFPAGQYNTLFLIDTLPTIDAYLVTDAQLVPPADSGVAYIRLVHVGKGVGNVSLANTTTATAVDTVIKNIGYKSHSPFVKVNSGAGKKFQLFNAGTTTKVGSELTSVTLTPNRIYTLYLRGRVATGNAYPPTLSIITTR